MPRTERTKSPAASEHDTSVSDLRVSLFITAVLISGCATTSMTQRTALGVLPATPPTLAGTSGIALTSRFMPVTPQPDVATALPYLQPELSGVVRVGRHLAFSGRTSIVAAGLPVQSSTGPGVRDEMVSVESTLGIGAELPIGDHFGILGAAEVGVVFASVNVKDTTFNTRSIETSLVPTIRGAGGVFVTFGPVRVFAAAEAGDIVRNDQLSVRTTCFGCFTTDTGGVGSQALILGGGGVRVMLGKYVSLSGEGWSGAQTDGRALPFLGALTLRVGSFDLSVFGKPPPPVVEPPPIPEWEEPATQL